MTLACPCCGRLFLDTPAPVALTSGAVSCRRGAVLSLRNCDGVYVLDVLTPGEDYPAPDWVAMRDESA